MLLFPSPHVHHLILPHENVTTVNGFPRFAVQVVAIFNVVPTGQYMVLETVGSTFPYIPTNNKEILTNRLANPLLHHLKNTKVMNNQMDLNLKHEKGRRCTWSLLWEVIIKPDPALRACAHNQECYNELMEWRDEIVNYLEDPSLREEFSGSIHIIIQIMHHSVKTVSDLLFKDYPSKMRSLV